MSRHVHASEFVVPAHDADKAPATIRSSIIVPTYNERDNVVELIARIQSVLPDDDWEIIFVDDNSRDGTAEVVRGIARKDRRVRCIERFGRRGLAGACMEGMAAASGQVLVVMDADLQHDESLLPQLIDSVTRDGNDIAVASRFAVGGSAEGLSSSGRQKLSEVGIRIAQLFVGRGTTDPFSGFFAVRREHVEPALKTCAPIGFKLLLDMLMVLKPKSLRVADVPMRFRKRHAGESKLSPMIMYELALMVLRNLISPTLSLRFVSFCLIGGSGVLVHLAVLAACASGAGLAFPVAQSIATVVAMFTNFVLNNFLTYRDRQLKGFGFYVGLAKFFAICSAGAFANVAIASAMYTSLQIGWLLPSMAGIVAGAVWNYALSSRYTWAERM